MDENAFLCTGHRAFCSIGSLTAVVTLRVPTSLEAAPWRSLAVSILRGKFFFIKHILNLKDELATLQEHNVCEFTLHFISSLGTIRMVGAI